MLKRNFLRYIPLGALLLAFIVSSCQSASENNAEDSSTEENLAVQNTANEDAEGFVTIFNGENLEGWEGDPGLWRVENGSLVGEITPGNELKANSFIIWQGGEPADFELKTEFRITETGNSGINYRSERLDTIPYALRGYQADIDGRNRYTGQNYEERKRTTLAYRGQQTSISSQPNPNEEGSLRANVERNAWKNAEVTGNLGEDEALKAKINAEDWNEAHLIIKGNRMQHYINGVLMSDVTDNDTVNRNMKGLLGVQVHVGPPMKVEYRNIRLKEL
ncbi:DUF1080 domain-containing protein [Catalinimonas sp. 4WD22]|uniref:3-keto-disaccharide hydrolase n=1 Tax=Catalinimonas locisalis TaxID=3133978 RepID=UPI0031016253